MPIGLFAENSRDTSSTGSFRIKGVDFRCGFGPYYLSDKHEVNLLRHFSNDQNNYYKFDQAHLETDHKGVVDLYLGFVLVPTYYVRNQLFYKEEFRVGLNYSFMNNGPMGNFNQLTYDTIQNTQTKEVSTFVYGYKYSSQGINLSYLLNRKIFKKNLAVYTGIGVSFGFAIWRTEFKAQPASMYQTETLTLQNNHVSTTSKIIPLENFATGCASFYIPIGLKYNLNCDLNVFTEGHFGYRFYSKGLNEHGTWVPEMMANFGFRYKIVDDAVVHQTQLFW